MPTPYKHYAQLPNVLRLSTKSFVLEHGDKGTQVFVADASTLQVSTPYTKIYNDACDLGFILMSAKTGNERVVVLEDIEKDVEGDIQAWEFRSVPVGDEKSFTVLIFND